MPPGFGKVSDLALAEESPVSDEVVWTIWLRN